jgi:hypothetical protein
MNLGNDTVQSLTGQANGDVIHSFRSFAGETRWQTIAHAFSPLPF